MAHERTSEHLETCWRVVDGSTSRILTCSLFGASTAGVELRVGYLLDVPLHSETVVDINAARALAQSWLKALRGGLSPRDLQHWNVYRK
jgi:hypothetical protein